MFDCALDALAAFPGTQILAFVLRDFAGKPLGFDFFAHPAGVLAAAQVMKPRVVVGAFGDLHERSQIVGPQV